MRKRGADQAIVLVEFAIRTGVAAALIRGPQGQLGKKYTPGRDRRGSFVTAAGAAPKGTGQHNRFGGRMTSEGTGGFPSPWQREFLDRWAIRPPPSNWA
jgi:hypothetical protein